MFAGDYVRMSTQRPDWPLGPALKKARGRMPKREAARKAGISEGRWRQLESGYQGSEQYPSPVTTKPSTVIAVAMAVGLNVPEALELAGFDPADYAELEPAPAARPLKGFHIDELLAEVRSRVRDDAQRGEPLPWARPLNEPTPPSKDSGVNGRKNREERKKFGT